MLMAYCSQGEFLDFIAGPDYLDVRPLAPHLIDLYPTQCRWKNGEKARTH